jgi:putative IMPACT (imprinted ancient) family translation regulator
MNDALNDECEALNSIYGDDTITITSSTPEKTSAVITFPNKPFSILLEFAADYPDVPLHIIGTNSTGNTAKGAGEAALTALRATLGHVYRPGEVCLYDLVEEGGQALESVAEQYGENQGSTRSSPSRSAEKTGEDQALTPEPAASVPPPKWTLTEAITVSKSVFVARACPVSTMTDVTNAVTHLLSSNKKVASATHNIKAWRFQDGTGATTQDYDDDGESAAGGRMLHLMQLMDVWNVLVVVTRWYGGVKLGPDRFRVINNAARKALTAAGYVREDQSRSKK